MAGIRFEDLPPAAQAKVYADEARSETLVSEQANPPEKQPSRWDVLGNRLAGQWPGLADGFWYLLAWAGLLFVLQLLFGLLATVYLFLALLALGIGVVRSLRGGGK